MTAVRMTTDEFPPIGEFLEARHRNGQDTYDEWWDGEYKVVTGPTPEHGHLLTKLVIFLDPLTEALGLRIAVPVNIGINKEDCRVPDLGVYHPDTPRTSPAFLQTALLVVEVLSPGELPGAKLRFYEAWGVQEYLEIDQRDGAVRLLGITDAGWARMTGSTVLGFDVADKELVRPDGQILDLVQLCKG